MPRRTTDLDALIGEDIVEISPAHYENKTVPNQQPLITNQPYKIAICGEAPGVDEVREGKPFVGASGRFLTSLLSKANIVRDACFIGNVSQTRPPSNDITLFALDGPEIQDGLKRLETDLSTFNPNVCLLLGKTALWAANGQTAIGDWRGTFFIGDRGPFKGRKCLATYHPAAALRMYEYTPLIMFDIRKALGGARTKDHVPPYRDLRINQSLDQLLTLLDLMNRSEQPVSIDIEGYVDAMTCVSIANSHDNSVLIPFTKYDGTSYWSEADEILIWESLSRLLANPKVGKIFQNGLYDRFVFQWSYGCIIAGNVDDTMLLHWELYCELEKNLGVQVSLYCGDEPYYKFERKSGNQETQWKYCCKDSAVTYEIAKKVNQWLPPSSRTHYRFNMNLLHPILYMENHGLLYNAIEAAKRLKEVNKWIYEYQAKLDAVATTDSILVGGETYGIPTKANKSEWLAKARSIMGYKRDPTVPKKEYVNDYDSVIRILLGPAELSLEERGYISTVLGLTMNIKGAVFKDYLYETLKLPKQYIKDPQGREHLSTNYESLLKLSKKTSHPAVQLAIDISSLRTRSQMLHISCDQDGRVRAGYNIVGSETGRITCYTSPTGSGYALQTLPDADPLKPVGHPLHLGMRDLIVADPGCYLFKCDLKGADGWTVGAHLAALGDSTMLDDLLFGIKPAQVLCWMMRHQKEMPSSMSRDEIKELCKEVKKDDWDYFAYKQCIWGFCYLMGARKAASHVFNLSEGKVDMKESEMETAKTWLFRRYRVSLWWHSVGTLLSKQKYPPTLTAASGHIRKFFNRESDRLGEALAHEPQANTTYTTNSAANKLWYDADNRLDVSGRTTLRVKPMHQVHDELLMQARIEDTDWTIGKIKQWFHNPIQIAGQTIVIPFEGSYGTDWSMSEHSKKGSF
jgi:DNA polymerase